MAELKVTVVDEPPVVFNYRAVVNGDWHMISADSDQEAIDAARDVLRMEGLEGEDYLIHVIERLGGDNGQ